MLQILGLVSAAALVVGCGSSETGSAPKPAASSVTACSDPATGSAGSNGTDGASGASGATGPQGPVGLPGVQGPAGPTGAQGPAASNGATGPQGPLGPVGPTGPAGTPGTPIASASIFVVTSASTVNVSAPTGGNLPAIEQLASCGAGSVFLSGSCSWDPIDTVATPGARTAGVQVVFGGQQPITTTVGGTPSGVRCLGSTSGVGTWTEGFAVSLTAYAVCAK